MDLGAFSISLAVKDIEASRQYPAIRDVSENLLAIERAGYRVVGHFPLPPEAWWDDYYAPLQRSLEVFSARHAGDTNADETISATQTEIAMYRKYSDFYAYVFFVMQDPASPLPANSPPVLEGRCDGFAIRSPQVSTDT